MLDHGNTFQTASIVLFVYFILVLGLIICCSLDKQKETHAVVTIQNLYLVRYRIAGHACSVLAICFNLVKNIV
jgi:hypothetical protein